MEQLELLKQGVEAWNGWRNAHPDERVDLSGLGLKNFLMNPSAPRSPSSQISEPSHGRNAFDS
jgi:hypothetical protein